MIWIAFHNAEAFRLYVDIGNVYVYTASETQKLC